MRGAAAASAVRGAAAGPNPQHRSPRSAMEKGKLHKAGKDTTKRGRQVSGTRGLDKLGRIPRAALRGGTGTVKFPTNPGR